MQNGALGSFNAGICVNFDEENIKILIKHKVVPENFEAVVPLVGVNQATCRSVSVGYDPLDLRAEDISLEIYPELREVLVQVRLVLSE